MMETAFFRSGQPEAGAIGSELRSPEGHLVERAFLKDGVIHGRRMLYYQGGLRGRMEEHYTNGIRDGLIRRWSIDGRLVKEYEFAEGTGTLFELYETGEVETSVDYVENAPDGYIREFYKDGTVKSLLEVSAGEMSGLSLGFWPNGYMQGFGRFGEASIPVGPWIDFKEDGSGIEKIVYRLGGRDVSEEEYAAAAGTDNSLPAYRDPIEGYLGDIRPPERLWPVGYQRVPLWQGHKFPVRRAAKSTERSKRPPEGRGHIRPETQIGDSRASNPVRAR